MIIWSAILALSVLGLLLGLMLGTAEKYFPGNEDPKLARIEALLPGANCAACGYAGCHAFAEALVARKVDASGCLLGGKEIEKTLNDA